jgi:pimeloyl-ACP methyl ester carboxylesterase
MTTRQPPESGTGPGILFLHGYACSSRDWMPVADSISRTHPGYAPDFPGHGESREQAPLTFDELVHFAADAIQRQFWQPPVLVGHSMGGMVGIALAADQPDLVSGIVLADAFPHLPTAAELFGGPDDPSDPFGFGSVMDAQTPRGVQDHIRTTMKRGAERAGTTLFSSLLDVDLRPMLSAISVPSLLLLADRRWITEDKLPALLGGLGYHDLPALATTLIPSHHFVMLEQPGMVAGLLRSFLDHLANPAVGSLGSNRRGRTALGGNA